MWCRWMRWVVAGASTEATDMHTEACFVLLLSFARSWRSTAPSPLPCTEATTTVITPVITTTPETAATALAVTVAPLDLAVYVSVLAGVCCCFCWCLLLVLWSRWFCCVNVHKHDFRFVFVFVFVIVSYFQLVFSVRQEFISLWGCVVLVVCVDRYCHCHSLNWWWWVTH